MSINPSDAQRSAASLSSSSYANASSRHGSRREPPRSLASWSEGLPCGRAADAASGSAATYAFDDTSLSSSENHVSVIAAGGNSHSLSKKVNRYRVNDFKKNQFGKKRGTNVEYQSTVGEEVPPYCQSNQFVHVVDNEHPFVNVNLFHPSGPSSFQGNGNQSSTRRNNTINANHLLNFYYDPISRSEPRAPPPRRQRKIKPYNKDLFLQANYRFVVLNRGGSEVEPIDPDKMLNWEDVVCVRYSTPLMVQCPICLETPLCPQITTCGHIYCFPCILRYLFMGDENHKGGCWKKCPLCFMVISIKDLYTVLIENVKHFSVGDHVHFTLLTRPKDSVFPIPKDKQIESAISSSADDLCDAFSKFIVTTDVGLSVREGKSDLSSWLHKADSGLVDDLEKLPYVCAALEQLEERMKMWRELHAYNVNTQNSDSFSSLATNLESDKLCTDEPQCAIPSYIPDEDGSSIETMSNNPIFPVAAESEHLDSSKQAPPHNENEKLQHDDISSQKNSISNNGVTERDSYSFYQAADGQLLILHPLNMKCLLHHFGSYDMLPSSINGEVLELEAITQSEAMRKRYRYLSHFSLTTTFQLCELDLKDLLPPSSLAPFMDEINKREKQRRRLAKKEKNERAKTEAASYINLVPSARTQFAQKDIVFSSEDFEALTTNSIPSSSPPTAERKLFSDVTRLGFAAAHDSPSLRGERAANSSGHVTHASNVQAARNMTTSSFATILSSAREVESSEQHTNALVKKGKKPNKVLLSTAGGRRY